MADSSLFLEQGFPCSYLRMRMYNYIVSMIPFTLSWTLSSKCFLPFPLSVSSQSSSLGSDMLVLFSMCVLHSSLSLHNYIGDTMIVHLCYNYRCCSARLHQDYNYRYTSLISVLLHWYRYHNVKLHLQWNELKCREPLPALMQMSMHAYLISTCGHVTLAKMAENSLKFWPMLLRILLYKKQCLPGNSCYNCIVTVAIQNSGRL